MKFQQCVMQAELSCRVMRERNFSIRWKIFVVTTKLTSSNFVEQELAPPLVCICIPTYNAALTIRQTLASILGQNYPNLVFHVSDNASTDATLEIIESFSDPRVTIHRHEINVGGEGNFNRCIKYAEGKYTAIFHADDVYEPKMVSRQVNWLELNSQVGAVFTEAKTIDANGRVTGLIGQSFLKNRDIDLYDFPLLFKAILKRGNFIVCPSAMLRTDVLKNEIQRWRGELFRSSADLDVWLRIASSHYVAFLKEPLMKYRVDNKQFSNQVRLRTTRSDFFLVTDFYLSNKMNSYALKKQDERNYRVLLNNDRIWRSINLFCLGKIQDSKTMIRSVLNFDSIVSSLSSKRNLMMMCVAIFLYLLSLLKLQKIGATILNHLRKTFNK